MWVAASAVVDERTHAGNTDRDFGQSFAPRSAEAVTDDYWDLDSEMLFEVAAQLAGGPVGIFGEQYGVLSSIDIRNVDAAIGANEAVFGLGDHDAMFPAHDAVTLA